MMHKMEMPIVFNHTTLLLQIQLLKERKSQQEIELVFLFKEAVVSVNPVTMAKNALHNFIRDKQVQHNVTTIAVNAGVTMLIDKFLGKNKSVKGFLSAVLVEHISTYFINNYGSKLLTGMDKLIQTKDQD